jgi:RNA 2',3'-cyclic 3'-phosphodiesterase
MPRLFTGLEIPPDIGARLALYRGGLGAARWVEPSDYHVTLRFLGDVGPSDADLFAREIADTGRGSISVTIAGLDVFGGDKPRALFARVEPSRPLAELQAGHERAARRVGFAPETRRFTPHVTLARLKDAPDVAVAAYLSARPMLASMTFTARRFVIYSSRDSVGGGPYVVEAAYPLSKVQ